MRRTEYLQNLYQAAVSQVTISCQKTPCKRDDPCSTDASRIHDAISSYANLRKTQELLDDGYWPTTQKRRTGTKNLPDHRSLRELLLFRLS